MKATSPHTGLVAFEDGTLCEHMPEEMDASLTVQLATTPDASINYRENQPMSTDDSHVQHTWNLTHDTGDQITVNLWTDNETVEVVGGDGEHYTVDQARRRIETDVLPKYRAAGYRVDSSYPVNDPAAPDADDAAEDAEPDGKPGACPECGSPVEFEPRYVTDVREGDAWLCTGCRWRVFVTA